MNESPKKGLSPEHIRARVRALVGEAILLRSRDTYDEAEARCLEALDLDPTDEEARELLGDVLVAQGRAAEGLSQYQQVLETAPSREALERKIARAVLRQAQFEEERRAAQELLAGKVRPEIERRPGIAALFSTFVPGLGQLYNHQYVKGVALCVAFVLAVFGLVSSAMVGLKGMLATAGARAAPSPGGFEALNVLVTGPRLWWLLGLFAIWLFAIGDAAVDASKTTYDRVVAKRPQV